MRVVVAGFKGGVGKTTTAIHLAATLQETGKTLLIDGDLNLQAVSWAEGGCLPYDVIDVRDAKGKYNNGYEHIVIDTQARTEGEDLAILARGCDLIILPTLPSAGALQALKKTIDALNELGTKHYKVLFTAVPPPPSKNEQSARELMEAGGIPMFKRGIRRYDAIDKACAQKILVHQVKGDPNARIAWKCYQEAFKELFL